MTRLPRLTLHSTVAVPLVLLQTLCTQEELSEEPNCFERGTAFAFAHLLGWEVILWTLGYSMIMPHQNLKQMAKQLVNPPLIAIALGLTCGLTGASKVFFGEGKPPLKFIGEATTTIGKSAVTILTLLMAAGWRSVLFTPLMR